MAAPLPLRGRPTLNRTRALAVLAAGAAFAMQAAPPAARAQTAGAPAAGSATSEPESGRNAFGSAAFGGVRPQVEALLGPDQLDAIYSIAETAEARVRSVLESVRARDGAYRTIRNDPVRSLRFRRDAFEAMRPIWYESVRQIDALLSPQQKAQLESMRDQFRTSNAGVRESDPPVPGGYGALGVERSGDIGGFVLRAMMRARAPA